MRRILGYPQQVNTVNVAIASTVAFMLRYNSKIDIQARKALILPKECIVAMDWNQVIKDSMPGVVDASFTVLQALLPLFVFVVIVRILYNMICRRIDRRR